MLYVLGAVAMTIFAVVVLNAVVRRRTVTAGGKAVLITGCDRGFGFMLAEALDSLGYRVFAGCLDASAEGANQLKQKTSANLVVVQLDVTKDEQVAEARAAVERHLDGCCMWAVVNNAGLLAFAEAEWCSLDTYKTMMDVNLMGTVRITKAFLPFVRAARGRIINVASLAGRVALPGFTSYSASKFAVVGFSDSLRREMSKFGVKIVTIEPTLYRTSLVDYNTLTNQNVKMWNAAAEEVRLSYGNTYFQSFLSRLGYLLQYSRRNVQEVIDDLVHAVTATHPYTRYVPALLSSQLPSDMFAMTPNRFQDFVLTALLKVYAKPSSLCVRNCVK